MMTLTQVLLAVSAVSAIAMLVLGVVLEFRAKDQTIARLWKRIEALEADKNALTESLCRAQGKPYVQSATFRSGPLMPSDGWFDGSTRITVRETK